MLVWARILVQVTIYRRLQIGRDGHLYQSEAYDISELAREYWLVERSFWAALFGLHVINIIHLELTQTIVNAIIIQRPCN